ncbi:uncharacterized protein [Blastocystis hominis]|uniref:Dynamin N-terminal domain-containing protein n=1 Tax=Blastocystis hominis TaxID=12968 RepID=D8M858_BLAHO|nr:uncharacterized protein [Blastocystis hominis]CBK24247.2 unnamed protein product [Blastocystis hominis]|eukprot:XP_012898295.1 uncharacterized protein [Blastocystis hominis]
MAADVGLAKLPPRNKATVMILGNHSSGKSSFINWYLKENVLPTGAAVESRGFTLVSQSEKEAPPLKGEATLRYFPQLKGIQKFGKGLIENLSTIVSISHERCFPDVDFIDTPGLVDGSVEYPFDVNRVILFLADFVDLIFVFLDPHEQALGSRTMEVVKLLNENHYDKMCYYLTKIDTLNSIADLMKVANQTTQNLALRVKNTHGWELPTIYLTSDDKLEEDNEFREVNMISKICDRIDLVVKQKIQDNLLVLEKDCNAILAKTESELHRSIRSNARMTRLRHYRNWNIVFWVLGLLCMGLYVAMQFVDEGKTIQEETNSVWRTLHWMKTQSRGLLPAFSVLSTVKWVASLCGIHGGMLLIVQLLMGCWKVPSKEKLGQLQANRKGLKAMIGYREELYNQYIKFWIVC